MTWAHLVAAFIAALALWIAAEALTYLGLVVIGDD